MPSLFVLADSSETFLLKVLVQLVVIIAAARAGGWLLGRMGQPQVVGEIATGLLLGPSCLGRLAPELSSKLFAAETEAVFGVLGQIGLIFLMFVVGLEFEFGQLRRTGRTAIGVAVAGIALPFVLGAALAWSIHSRVANDVSQAGFILFLATALSITAIPILGRIMMEFGLTRTRLGVLTISAAAVDDAVGWILLAAVSAGIQGQFSVGPILRMLVLTIVFVAVVFLVVRPLVRRWMVKAFTGDLNEPAPFRLVPFSTVLVLVLLSAITTNLIGVFSIFGPFVLGAALWDATELQRAARHRIEEFVTAFFLPVFFTYTGLRTNIGLLASTELWVMAAAVTVVAVVGKCLGCGLASRWGGLSWRESAAVAVMMNTRALMGLIAINVGRELGVITETVFCMLVIMAIATTIITAPLLRMLIPGKYREGKE